MNDEDLLYKPVEFDDENGARACGLLVAIFEDAYETTAGFAKKVEPAESMLPRFGPDYATYLPVEWRRLEWRFPTGEVGKLEVDFFSDKPYIDEKGNAYGWAEQASKEAK